MKTWVEISESRLLANYKTLAAAATPNTILAITKANAYGHNAALCAPILARGGAPWLGIADAQEGEAIRKNLSEAGIKSQPRILVMCGTLPEESADIIRNNLTPVVWQQHQLEALAAAVHQHGDHTTPLPIHLEIDTGMSRQGMPPGERLHTLLHWLKSHPLLRLEGVLTHFAEPELATSPNTRKQRRRFEEALASVVGAGFQPQWIHAGNSSLIDNQDPDENLSWLTKLAATVKANPMVRPGIALYGYCLPIDSASPCQPKLQPSLQPVLAWKTRILALQDIAPGDTIGYNATYIATKPMRIALLPVGYSDGLRRELSSTNTKPGGWVLIDHQKAPIVGRISMNLTTVDVTNIPQVKPGDEVTLLGENITADDHAMLARTISYEILCAVRSPAHLVL
ncbi:MAG TPA: alanine racemase [Edaphobacter sp.]|nr:alanine racemase [Edaphobacter sp.]